MDIRAGLLLMAIFLATTTSALNVLMLASVQSTSHLFFTNAIVNLLLERGHHVYELTTRPPATPHPNRTSFVIDVELPYGFSTPMELSQRSNTESLKLMATWSTFSCQSVLHSQASRDLLALARNVKKRPHIDVVLHDYITQQCIGPFAREFGNAPVIAITAYGNAVEIDEVVGGPLFPGFIPHDVVVHPHYDQPVGWLKRIENKWAYLIEYVLRYYHQHPQMDAISKEFFGDDAPTIEEYKRSVALALVSSHPLIQGARPQLPSVIQIGGVHLSPAKQLPNGPLKDFIDGARDGFILMSFGSIVPIPNMEPWRREGLFRAFKRLSPLRIVLKWENEWNQTENGTLPENVFLTKWIPQNEIQAHPNIRLFVTHGGGLSTIEVIAHALPVVVVPFMYDQYTNAYKLEALNAGILIPFEDLNEETFYRSVRTVIDDKKYKNSVRRLSDIYFDQPETPRERAAFWIEFVARHRGAAHFRSPGETMSWITRWMIDDVIIVISIISIIIFLIRRLCSALCKNATGRQAKSKRA